MTKPLPDSHIPVLAMFKHQGVIPSFYHSDLHTLVHVMKIAYQCGARTFEFVHHRDSRSRRFFDVLLQEAAALPGMKLGVGAVLDPATAQAYIKDGAAFIVSPFIHEQTSNYCHQKEVLWIPGCSHLQDVSSAVRMGAQVVTILPVSGSGLSFMKQISVAYPAVTLIPSFGNHIEENTFHLWFDAGALSIRLGDVLFARESVAIRDWTKIEQQVYQIFQTAKLIKKNVQQAQSIL